MAKITEQCPSYPDNENGEHTHECLSTEMRCAYCGVRLAPYPCHACGRFLTAARMAEAAEGAMPHQCEDCTP